MELLIASGRDLGDLRNQIDHPAIAIARERKMTHVVWLLNGFKTNPSRTRRELCVRFKCLTELVAELYAVMVFLGNGLLQLKQQLSLTPLRIHMPQLPVDSLPLLIGCPWSCR